MKMLLGVALAVVAILAAPQLGTHETAPPDSVAAASLNALNVCNSIDVTPCMVPGVQPWMTVNDIGVAVAERAGKDVAVPRWRSRLAAVFLDLDSLSATSAVGLSYVREHRIGARDHADSMRGASCAPSGVLDSAARGARFI